MNDDQTQSTPLTDDMVPAQEDAVVVEDGSQASVLLNIENMIKSHDLRMTELREEMKKHTDMIQNILDNDENFLTFSEKGKELNKQKSQAKSNALKQPNAVALVEKVKGMKTEMRELQSAFSEYLKEYLRMSGLNEIEGYDGELREIVYIAKLVRKAA